MNPLFLEMIIYKNPVEFILFIYLFYVTPKFP